MIAVQHLLGTALFAAAALLPAGCGGRSGVLEPTTDGGNVVDLTQCMNLCDEVFSTCGNTLSFSATACVDTCAEERPFDDCVFDCDLACGGAADCGPGCSCVEHCYLGDVLSCSGFCKWLRVEECRDIDAESCEARCNLDPQFASCVDGCSIGDCTCLESCT